jgi:hypothetical protein
LHATSISWLPSWFPPSLCPSLLTFCQRAFGQSARELSGISNRALQFLSSTLFSASSSYHTKEGPQSSGSGSDYYLLSLLGGIKLWLQLSIRETLRESLAHGTTGLHGSDEAIDESSKDSQPQAQAQPNDDDGDFELKESQPLHDRFPPYLIDYLELLFSCLQSYGAEILDLKISSGERQALVREVSTTCLLQMLAIKAVGKGISTQEWLTIAWAFLDSNERCRQKIFQTFSSLIQTHCLHPRFLALPCLLASDTPTSSSTSSTHLSQMANQTLLFTIRRLNKTHIALCEKAMEAQERGHSQEKNQFLSLAKVNSPECMIPYLFYLLSHHPDFPTSLEISAEGDEERLKGLYRSIKMMYTVILQSVGNDNNTLSILLKQVQIIFQFYSDRHRPPPRHSSSSGRGSSSSSSSTSPLQFVLRIALYILEGQIKTQLQPYPGDINLPMDLYELRKTTDPKIKLDESSVARAITILTRLEGHRAKAHSTLLKKKSSPDKTTATHGEKRRGGEAKKRERKSTPEKERQKRSATGIARPRRSATSTVSYVETRDSDDEAEMDEIEEHLDRHSQSFSSQSSPRGGKRSLSSSGSRQSLESNASGRSYPSDRLSISSVEEPDR